MAPRPTLLPLLSIAIATAATGLFAAYVPGRSFGAASPGLRSTPAGSWQLGRSSATTRSATGGDSATAEADSIEVGGFAAFVVGLALLPHTVHAIIIAFGVVTGGEFGLGQFGIQLISCATSLCLASWSLGSFIERGKGLPAGPLGLLGLSEGLSYLAALGLTVAVVVSGTRGPSAPSMPAPSAKSSTYKSSSSVKSAPDVPSFKAPDMPSFKAPEMPSLKVPDFKVPDIKLPEFKVPDIKVPDIKLPEFKVPDIKVPEFKAPDFKVPEFKAPDIEVKAPEPPKAPEKKAPAPEVKAPEVKLKAPAPASKSGNDYTDLFD